MLKIVLPNKIWLSLFAASIGGQMGLFIGASVLTIMEFIEIIFLLLLFILKRLSSKPRNSLENADIWADIHVLNSFFISEEIDIWRDVDS